MISDCVESMFEAVVETMVWKIEDWEYYNRDDVFELIESYGDYISESLYEQIETLCIYTSDCMEIITEYGLANALQLYKEEHSECPEDEVQIASEILVREFWDKYKNNNNVLEKVADKIWEGCEE